jgi:predicted membrane protein DUF2306
MIVMGTRQTEAVARPSMIPLGIVVAMAVWFINGYAYRYLTLDIEHFGIFRPRGDWLILHVAGGTAALLIGPVQFWLGSTRRYMTAHRMLGIGYLMSVAVSSATAIYLAAHTDFGWVFGMGLTSLAIAWIITTGLAVVAIARYLVDQHREWMIRSYVVTFSFVLFQVIVETLELTRTGTMPERLTAASWLCWSVPLLITEAVLQVRKMFVVELRKPRVAADYADYADGNTL